MNLVRIMRWFDDNRKPRVVFRHIPEDVAKAFLNGEWTHGTLRGGKVKYFYGYEKE